MGRLAVRRNPSLKDAVRTVQAAQYLERRHMLIREGKHASPPADMPPTLASGSVATGSAAAGSAAAAAADPHAHARAHAHARPSQKATVCSVQTAQHLERKLYLIREGKHAPPPAEMPPTEMPPPLAASGLVPAGPEPASFAAALSWTGTAAAGSVAAGLAAAGVGTAGSVIRRQTGIMAVATAGETRTEPDASSLDADGRPTEMPPAEMPPTEMAPTSVAVDGSGGGVHEVP